MTADDRRDVSINSTDSSLQRCRVIVWASLSAFGGTDVLSERPHVELEGGFFMGDRSLGIAPFELEGEDGRPIGGLDAPFEEYPLRAALVAGPRLEARVVAPPLRGSFGVQLVFPQWDVLPPEVSEWDGAHVPVLSSVRSTVASDLVFAIGAEAPLGVCAPFAEVVGTIHSTRVSLEVDGIPASYTSKSFSLGPRAGLRLQVSDHTFLQAAGEWTPFGPSRWGATLGVGLAL